MANTENNQQRDQCTIKLALPTCEPLNINQLKQALQSATDSFVEHCAGNDPDEFYKSDIGLITGLLLAIGYTMEQAFQIVQELLNNIMQSGADV